MSIMCEVESSSKLGVPWHMMCSVWWDLRLDAVGEWLCGDGWCSTDPYRVIVCGSD
jgi:hypothetical protein